MTLIIHLAFFEEQFVMFSLEIFTSFFFFFLVYFILNYRTVEGKRAITFVTYCILVNQTLDVGYEASQYSTNPLFLVLAWSLMSRYVNIGHLHRFDNGQYYTNKVQSNWKGHCSKGYMC